MQNATLPNSFLNTTSLPGTLSTEPLPPTTLTTTSPEGVWTNVTSNPEQSNPPPQSNPTVPSSENQQPSIVATTPIQTQPPAATPLSPNSTESLLTISPSGTFEHTLTDLAPPATNPPPAATITSVPSSASDNNATKPFFPFLGNADVPHTPASNGSQPSLTSTTIIVSEYTAINGTWLPNVETATTSTDSGLLSSTDGLASTTTISDASSIPPLTTHDSSSPTSAQTDLGNGIGGFIWSGLGGGPRETASSTNIGSEAPASSALPSDVSSTTADSSALGSQGPTPTFMFPNGTSTISAATRTSSPMLVAATGGVTAVRITVGEVLGLCGFVTVVMALL